MQTRPHPISLLLLVAMASFGCEKKTDEQTPQGSPSSLPRPPTCATDDDCSAGLLCEAKACVPASLAKEVREARKAKNAPEVIAAAPSAEPPASPVPSIPTAPSNPPQGTEWKQGVAVNTQQSDSQPDKCTVRVLREWVQVTCRDDYASYEGIENFGTKGRDYFASALPNKVVDLVFRLRKGKAQKARICGEKAQATLFVNWPAEKDRPTHIALGKGAKCEDTEDSDKDAGK